MSIDDDDDDITPEQQQELDRLMTGRESHWIPGLTFDGKYYRFDGEMDADTFGQACLNLDRNNGPALLFDMYHAGALAIDLHPGVVADVWSMAEFPEKNLEPETWRDLFEEAGYTHDGRPAPQPSAPVTVYRGCNHERRLGMAWTTDLERAQWFADRPFLKGTGQVYVHRADPLELLAFIDSSGRGEAEYVLDPSPEYLNDNTITRL